ncbi:MAG: N-acetylmuramoyl-L-alanine amidase [Clostridia bacterium]|nr:N-acetylmuramoyl-L-alanine amidase [Clostridia bacterium]
MKTAHIFISLLLILSFTLLFSLTYSKNSKSVSTPVLNKPKIIIDAGHGSPDGGTQTPDGTLEKDLNLAIAKKIAILCDLNSIDYIMTRTTDDCIADKSAETIRQKKISDTKNRLKIINDNPQAIYLSVHQNYFSDQKYSGAQVFYSKNNPMSSVLAETVQKQIVELLQPQNYRIAKPTGTEIYLLYHAKNTAIMVECGFLSNPKEAELLKSEEYQNKMAFAVFCGILKYLEA